MSKNHLRQGLSPWKPYTGILDSLDPFSQIDWEKTNLLLSSKLSVNIIFEPPCIPIGLSDGFRNLFAGFGLKSFQDIGQPFMGWFKPDICQRLQFDDQGDLVCVFGQTRFQCLSLVEFMTQAINRVQKVCSATDSLPTPKKLKPDLGVLFKWAASNNRLAISFIQFSFAQNS